MVVHGFHITSFACHEATLNFSILTFSFTYPGKNKVWCLYPNKSGVPKSAKDYFLSDMPSDEDCALSKVFFYIITHAFIFYKLKSFTKITEE